MKKNWKTKNGDVIEISKMDDNHLINTYNFLLRITKNGVKGRQKVFNDFGYDGDSYMPDFVWVDTELTQKEALKLIPEFKWIKDEIKKRKL